MFETSRTVDIFGPLLGLLKRSVPDWFINRETSSLLTRLITHKSTTATDEHRTAFLSFMCSQLQREAALDVRVAVNALQRILLVAPLRDAFARREAPGHDGLALLVRIADANLAPSHFQLLYEVCCCCWLCLYCRDVAEHPPAGLVETLIAAIRQVQKEKVRRVCLAALRSLLVSRDNRQRMVACQLHRLVSTLRGHKVRSFFFSPSHFPSPLFFPAHVSTPFSKKWGDPEIEDDLTAIEDQLTQEVQAMSSWDMYRSEVISGVLEWSPVHKSERFWRENVNQFEENNWAVLSRLRELVRTSKDKQVLSVACYDLGEFVRFHPRGRTLLNQANVKVDLMQLLLHEDADVRKNALFSLQKIMANKVEYSGV